MARSAASEKPITANEYHPTTTGCGAAMRPPASKRMNAVVASSKRIWPRPETFSNRWCPKGWVSSAGRTAKRRPAYAERLAARSRNECAASARMASDPVSRPTASLRTMSTRFAPTDTSAAVSFSWLAASSRSTTPGASAWLTWRRGTKPPAPRPRRASRRRPGPRAHDRRRAADPDRGAPSGASRTGKEPRRELVQRDRQRAVGAVERRLHAVAVVRIDVHVRHALAAPHELRDDDRGIVVDAEARRVVGHRMMQAARTVERDSRAGRDDGVHAGERRPDDGGGVFVHAAPGGRVAV